MLGWRENVSDGRTDSLAHATIARAARGYESPFETSQHSIVLSRKSAIIVHSLALGDVKVPVLSKLLINAFY
jgi:hypothetical protein